MSPGSSYSSIQTTAVCASSFQPGDVHVPCLTGQVRRGESTTCIIWKRMKRSVFICSPVQMLFSQFILLESFGFLEKIQQLGFPGSSAGKESTCNARHSDLIPGSGRSPGEGIGYPLQYSWASLMAQLVKNPSAVQETWVQSLGWEIPWRRERLLTPVFWPGEFPGLYSLWGHKKSDMTERVSFSLSQQFKSGIRFLTRVLK